MQIRVATAADAPALRCIYAPIVESTAISFEVEVPSVSEMTDRILDRQPAYPWLVAEAAGSIIGYAYAGKFAPRAAYGWSVETSIYVSEKARGRGTGKTLYAALFEILTLQGYRCAMAGITLPNAPSVGLHEESGFSLVGVYRAVGWKLGSWHDVGWWEKVLRAPTGAPQATVPYTELPEGAVQAALANAVKR
jgi:phosphinothricin acetyltransferase